LRGILFFKFLSHYTIATHFVPEPFLRWIPIVTAAHKAFFHHFWRFTIKGGLHFFFTLSNDRWRSAFAWLRFFRPNSLFTYCILFRITCTSVTRGIMLNRGSCGGVSTITRVTINVKVLCESISEA